MKNRLRAVPTYVRVVEARDNGRAFTFPARD